MDKFERVEKSEIAYFDKDASDIPDFIQDTTFQLILNKLKNKQEKAEFQQLFGSRGIEYKGEQIIGYGRVKPEDTASNHRIFELMKKAGYYDLTIYDFIKHLSDKRGAHIDMGIAPLIKIVNGDKSQMFTPIVCFRLTTNIRRKNANSRIERLLARDAKCYREKRRHGIECYTF